MRPHCNTTAAWMILGLLTLVGCSAGEQQPATTTDSTAEATIVADAGPDQSVFLNTFVTLDGSKSTNANGTGLTYSWTLKKPVGSAAVLSDSTAVNPTFRPDTEGLYEATLIVVGDNHSSTPDSVIVTVSGTNPPPEANAGPDQTAHVNEPVLLNGTNSRDKNGDSLSFEWRLVEAPSGSTAVLFDKTTVAPSFTPYPKGTYIVELIVFDGTSFSTPDSTTIHASDKPSPTAVASPTSPMYFPLNTSPIILDGSNSHTNPSGGNLTYKWTFNSPNPGPTLTDADKQKASFVPSPNAAATYVAQLKVTEEDHPGPEPNFGIDTVTVVLGPLAEVKAFLPSNLSSPILTCTVTSCGTATIPVDTPIQLDGTNSAVAPLTYLWRITNPSTGATLSNQASDKPTFVATAAEPAGTTYSLELEVTDQSPTGNKNIRPFNLIAKTGPPVSIGHSPPNPAVPESVSLWSDSTNSAFRYTWELTDRPTGSSAVLANVTVDSTSSMNSFSTDKSGDYKIKLTIKDTSTTPATSVSNTKTITANNPPQASFTSDATAGTCRTVTLNGSASSDSYGTINAYNWSLNSKPSGSITTLSSSGSSASFMADKSGTFGVSLTVTDNLGSNSAPDSANISVLPNTTGETIDRKDGLTDGTKKISYCSSCHPGDGNLSEIKNTEEVLRDKVTGVTKVNNLTHSGGIVSNYSGLNTQIEALRAFLDSTLPSCP